MLGKDWTTDVRQRSLQIGEIAIGHDFTEALNITHNEEVQSMHFGGSVNVSIEGYTVHYRSHKNCQSTIKEHIHVRLNIVDFIVYIR